MAARKQRWHPEEVRKRIQASQLINRLQDNAISSKPLMDASQVQSARILLNKVLPDLSATQLSGDQDNPIVIHEIKRKIIDSNSGDTNS